MLNRTAETIADTYPFLVKLSLQEIAPYFTREGALFLIFQIQN